MNDLVVKYLESIAEEMYLSILIKNELSSMDSMWKSSGFPPTVRDPHYTLFLGKWDGKETELERYERFKKLANNSQTKILKQVDEFIKDDRDDFDKSFDLLPLYKQQHLQKYKDLKNRIKEKGGLPFKPEIENDEG